MLQINYTSTQVYKQYANYDKKQHTYNARSLYMNDVYNIVRVRIKKSDGCIFYVAMWLNNKPLYELENYPLHIK